VAVNTTSEVVDLLGRPINTSGESEQASGPQMRGYRAMDYDDLIEGKGSEEWFRVHGDLDELPESVELFRYIDLLKVYSPHHAFIMIACQDAAFQITGRHLGGIPELMQDRKLRGIYLFNPKLHVEPNEGEPVIYELTRVSMVDEVETE